MNMPKALTVEETMALADAAFIVECARDKRLADIARVDNDLIKTLWVAGYLSGRRDALAEASEAFGAIL